VTAWVLAAVVVSVIVYFIFYIVLSNKFNRTKDLMNAEATVEKIISEARAPFRQHWVSEEAIEFIYLVFPSAIRTPDDKCVLWVRVHVAKTFSKATIFYTHEIKGDPFINFLAEEFDTRGWLVDIEATMNQPNPSECIVHNWDKIETDSD